MKKIAIVGTFDVHNYGDLLFPLLARRELAQFGYEIVPVSPTSTSIMCSGFSPISFDEFEAAATDYSGIIVGGGNIIHSKGSKLLHYERAGISDSAYFLLWAGAAIVGARNNIPVVWNAPGISERFDENDTVSLCVKSVSYCSVRDSGSAEYLNAVRNDFTVLVDTALGIDNLYSPSDSKNLFQKFLNSHHLSDCASFVVFHVKARSLDCSEEQFALFLDEFSRKFSVVPILIGLGICHGDYEVATRISHALQCRHHLLEMDASLELVTAVLGSSLAVYCTSLHARIVSVAYNVPSVLITKPNLLKYRGFDSQIGPSLTTCDTWDAAFTLDPFSLPLPALESVAIDNCRKKLIAHWGNISNLLSESPRHPETNKLLLEKTRSIGNVYKDGYLLL